MEQKIIVGGSSKGQNPAQDKVVEHGIPKEYIDDEFPVPTDDVELPSGGAFYPNQQKTIKIKYLGATEDDVLFSPELIKSGKVLDALLQVAVIDETLKPEDLLVGDKNAVLLALRRTGLGDDYKPGTMVCPSCNEKYEPVVDLSKLKLKKLETMPDSNGEYDFLLPTMNIPIKFKLLRGSDENIIEKKIAVSSNVKKGAGQFKVSKSVTERYIIQIMEVNGNRVKTTISNLVSKMPMRDSLAFREYMRLISPGVDFSYVFQCDNCNHVYSAELDINYRLFYPNATL